MCSAPVYFAYADSVSGRLRELRALCLISLKSLLLCPPIWCKPNQSKATVSIFSPFGKGLNVTKHALGLKSNPGVCVHFFFVCTHVLLAISCSRESDLTRTSPRPSKPEPSRCEDLPLEDGLDYTELARSLYPPRSNMTSRPGMISSIHPFSFHVLQSRSFPSKFLGTSVAMNS